jgi:hypothetical protein
LVSDASADELRAFVREFDPISVTADPTAALLGVLLLSQSDLIICSNSTYSRLACFLSDRPYIWFADTLVLDESRRYGYMFKSSLADAVPQEPLELGSADFDPNAVRRCFPIASDFETLPSGLFRYLASDGAAPIEVTDDLMYHEPVGLLPRC